MSTNNLSKYLINDPRRVVHEGIDGLVLTNPNIVKLTGNDDVKVVVQRHVNPNHIPLVSGGGEGRCFTTHLNTSFRYNLINT